MSHEYTATRSDRSLDCQLLDALESPWYRAVSAIQDAISCATTQFFAGMGLRTLHLPITTASISSPLGLGSDSSPVSVNFLGTETYLADSMQFMLEYGCRLHAPGCYYLMPSFRGEAADETHLNQFFHSEAEIPGTLDDVMSLVEAYIRFLTRSIMERHSELIAAVVDDWRHIDALVGDNAPFARVPMGAALDLLDHDPRVVEHVDPGFRRLTRLGERRLIERYGGFVWVTEPDHLSVPFYQAFVNGTRSRALAADLLFGVGEVVGAGQRHDTAVQLTQAIEMHGVDPEPYEWYIAMRERFPSVTSGFGLGTERYVCWLLNRNDVHDCQLPLQPRSVAPCHEHT